MNFAIIKVLPFLNKPKDLDPSYKMNLDIWDCFAREKKLHLINEEIRHSVNISTNYDLTTMCSFVHVQ